MFPSPGFRSLSSDKPSVPVGGDGRNTIVATWICVLLFTYAKSRIVHVGTSLPAFCMKSVRMTPSMSHPAVMACIEDLGFRIRQRFSLVAHMERDESTNPLIDSCHMALMKAAHSMIMSTAKSVFVAWKTWRVTSVGLVSSVKGTPSSVEVRLQVSARVGPMGTKHGINLVL